MSEIINHTDSLDEQMLWLRRIGNRIRGLYHKGITYSLNGIIPYYIVNEFPKSGGTWVGQMLSDCLGVPMPRHRLVGLERCVVHGHFLNPNMLKNVIVVWRDPRDLIVSFYYHSFFPNGLNNDVLVDLTRKRFLGHDPKEIRKNLPEFIRMINTNPISPRFTWLDFASRWVDRSSAIHTSYEAMRKCPKTELIRIIRALRIEPPDDSTIDAIVYKYRFTQAKRDAEQALSQRGLTGTVPFVREGVVGGWSKHFSSESLALVDQYYQPLMNQLGYD